MGGTRVTIKMDSKHTILLNKKLNKGGLAMNTLLSESRKKFDPYVPKETGTLKNTSRIIPDKGELVYPGPYARYQYNGKVMGSSIPIMAGGMLEGFFSPKGEKKKLTNRKLKYAGAPKRGSFWATRSWADNGDAIIRAVAIVVGGKVR